MCSNVLDPMVQDFPEQDIVMGELELPPQMDPKPEMAAVFFFVFWGGKGKTQRTQRGEARQGRGAISRRSGGARTSDNGTQRDTEGGHRGEN